MGFNSGFKGLTGNVHWVRRHAFVGDELSKSICIWIYRVFIRCCCV